MEMRSEIHVLALETSEFDPPVLVQAACVNELLSLDLYSFPSGETHFLKVHLLQVLVTSLSAFPHTCKQARDLITLLL